MLISCFGTKMKPCKTIYPKDYTDSYLNLNRNLKISPYFFQNGRCKFMQLITNKFECTFFTDLLTRFC